MTRRVRRAWTLIEVVTAIAIIAVLAAILYVATGGIREKARQAVCLSNLHQIGQAIWMYRQDYAGHDLLGTPAQMGLPRTPLVLNHTPRRTGVGSYLAADDEVFHCPNVPAELRDQLRLARQRWCLYAYTVSWPGLEPPGVPPFVETVRKRGDKRPLMIDLYHDFPRPDRPASSRFVLILRLDGSVSAGQVPIRGPSWRW